MKLRWLLVIFVIGLLASATLDSRFSFGLFPQDKRGNDPSASSEQAVEYGKVKEVIDGDTIKLETGETVRYLGINAPEIYKLENNSWVKTDECFNQKSKQENEKLVLGKLVKLDKDVSDKDKYGRLLRYAWVDNVFVNLELVKEGFAASMIIKPDTKYETQIYKAENEAKSQKMGLWQVCFPY